MTHTAIDEDDTDYDFQHLNRELDKTKSKVFLGKNAAFLGSLMSSMNFVWSTDLPTAATDGISFWWNPKWYLSLSEETRKTVLVHELWHPARLHMLRRDTRDPKIWNYACDIRINNDLENDGYSFKGVEDCWKDQSYGLQPEEDIYDHLMANKIQPPPNWTADDGDGDMEELSDKDKHKAIANVVRAVHQAKLGGQAGTLPGDIEVVLNQFLAPIIPWEIVLYQFFSDMLDEDYSWKRPNRRYQDIYLPSRFTDDGRLEHLIYYLDVSGSISDGELVRFNSEVKFIKDTLQPKKLTLVQFDTIIQSELVIEENDQFDGITIIGRGGTDLSPVREHIMLHKPTAAIIFSDLYVPPMKPLPMEFPVIWISVNNPGATVPFGKLLHIKA